MASRTIQPKSSRTQAEAAERLRKVVGRLGRSLRLTHVDGNLSPSQREVLSAIAREGPLRLSELANTEGLNPTMLSRIVTNLEFAKLVTRTADTADARVVHLSLTQSGRALFEEMRNERTDALSFALGELTADERRVVIESLPVLESLVETLRSRNQ
jgi:DNA-binding MarR family transcriptional regulator